jgi:tetratricopeptide (TPR) repeat protein
MNQTIAIAYAPENQNAVNKILYDFKNTNIDFNLISSKDYLEPSIFNQLEHFNGPIILLISVNFLQSLACMRHSLSLVTKKSDQLVPILVNGLQPDPNSGELIEIPTAIDKIGDIIPYINYWQSKYLEARSHKNEIRSEESEKESFENYSIILRTVSSEAGETLRHLRKYSPPSLIECRNLKNRYQSVQAQIPDFPFQENLFLEDEMEMSPIEDVISYPTPQFMPVYREFEEEIIDNHNEETEEALEGEIGEREEAFEETFHFGSSSTMITDEDNNFDTSPKGGHEDLVNDENITFPSISPTLPIGTTDLNALPIAMDNPPESSLLFEDTKETEGPFNISEQNQEVAELSNETQTTENQIHQDTSESESSFDAAVSLFHQVEKQYVNDLDRQFFHLNLVLRETENNQQKINFLQSFIDKNPTFLASKLAISKIYQSQQHWDEAKTILEEILLISPNDSESMYELASLLISHFPDRLERAGNLLKQCLKQPTFPKEALYTYAIYLNNISNKPYKALEYYLKTIEVLPNHKFANYDIATFYFNEGEKKIAKEFYLKAVQNNPELQIPDNDLAFEVTTF